MRVLHRTSRFDVHHLDLPLDAWANLNNIAATTNSDYTGCSQESGFSTAADGRVAGPWGEAKSAPFENRKGMRHPLSSLDGKLLQWYTPAVRRESNPIQMGKGAPPADTWGYSGPNVDRVVTFQIIKFSGAPVFVIPIGEVPSRSGWNCTQSQPGVITTPCAQGVDTDTNGTFRDEWTIGPGSYTPAGCGWNFTTHWQWCAAPKTCGTLTGYAYTDAVNMNGFVNPPNPFPLNTPVYP